MTDGYVAPPPSQKRRMQREQIRVLLGLLNGPNAKASYRYLIQQTNIMMKLAENLYPHEELSIFVPHDENQINPEEENPGAIVAKLTTTLTCLSNYVDVKNGNPTAHYLISDTLNKAREVLQDGHPICPVVLARIALEQGLKTLCDLKNVDYSNNDMAGQINDKLWKADVYEKHIWREIQSKLDFLNAPLHGGKEPSHAEIERMISWIDSFIDKSLTGDTAALFTSED